MNRLRLIGAALAILSVLIDGLFALMQGTSVVTLAAVAGAAACLAVVAPFEARKRGARWRVLFACLLYVVGIGVALGFAVLAGVDRAQLGMLAALAGAGVMLAIWAFWIRNRRSRGSGWDHYYDE